MRNGNELWRALEHLELGHHSLLVGVVDAAVTSKYKLRTFRGRETLAENAIGLHAVDEALRLRSEQERV